MKTKRDFTMSWIKVSSGIEPPSDRPLLCYCPEWCETGYQAARWSKETGFYYPEEPNELFNELVEEWTIFLEAD